MKRLALTLVAGVAVAFVVLAAPALSLRPYRPAPVDFELTPAAGGLAAAGARSGRGVVSPPLRAPKRFNLVGFRWSDGGEPAIAIRSRTDGGDWSHWIAVEGGEEDGPDPRVERGARGYSRPVWVGEADWVQYRMSEPVRGLRLHFVNSMGTATAADRAKTRLRQLAHAGFARLATLWTARAQAPQPAIVPRADWGADACPPRTQPAYGEVKAALVHHTVSTNDYTPEEAPAAVLAICRYHRNSNGWNDLGYNFVVDKYGTIYEGRAGGIDLPVIGAQAQGFNSETTGIANLGTHIDVPQSDAAIDAIARLIRWKLPIHGQPTAGTVVLTSAGGSANRYPRGQEIAFERISGHRDAGKTSCPGDALYAQLPDLRSRVGSVTPRSARTLLEASIAPPVVRFPDPVRIAGRLRLASGEPVAGAALDIQVLDNRGWRTVATTATGDDGTFERQLSPGSRSALRVHYSGGPSLRPSNSRRTIVKVRPLIEATRSVSRAKVGQTPIVAGRIKPRRAIVEIVVQRRLARRNIRVAALRVRAPGGRFRKGFRMRRPGLYRFYARFRGDDENLPAVSTPFYVRVVPTDGATGAG